MRHAIRYLPAFLALLIPLALLAWLGSRELSTQRDRAENFLGERAVDFLGAAVQTFDEEIKNYGDVLLGEDLVTEYPSLFAASRAFREMFPDVIELVVLDSDGYGVHPRANPMETFSWPYARPNTELAVAQALQLEGDNRGAIELLEALIANDTDDGASSQDSRSRTRAAVQLAGLYRAMDRKRDALKLFEETLASLGDLSNLPSPTPPSRRSRSRRSFERAFEPATNGLLCRSAIAELCAEIDGNREGLFRLLDDLGNDGFPHVSDGILSAVLDRAAAHLPDGAGDALAAACSGLAELRTSRQRGRDYSWRFNRTGGIGRQLQDTLRRTADNEWVHHAFETDLATLMLILRRVRPEDSDLYAGIWVGFEVDLTAFVNDALAEQLQPRDDGFHLDVLTPQGVRVLRHPLPEGADDWQSEMLRRSNVTNLQFQAIPRNAQQQLEARRMSARNRTLLLLALGLVGVGGAFFLVRSVSRETELANLKVDLVSRVSHELKTPLSMIKMYGDTVSLGRTRNQEETARFASIISREADRLTLWIDRILDFSRRQSGEITYYREPIDLSELVERVTEEYEPHVEAAGVTLVTNIDPGVHVEVDAGAMESALINLIENAVKYTPESAPDRTVEVSCSRRGATGLVEVFDRGVGVPADEQKKVFESFYRASTAGEARGAGLGLSLVQHFVQAHDGTVVAESRPGGGMIFRLGLPLYSLPLNG